MCAVHYSLTIFFLTRNTLVQYLMSGYYPAGTPRGFNVEITLVLSVKPTLKNGIEMRIVMT